MLWIVVIILLVLLIAASAPAYPYSRDWGYAPSGVLAAILLVLVVLWLLGVITIDLGGGTTPAPAVPGSPGRP